jgi:tRNA(fMet)-specific endonuclease VapC
VKYPVTFLLDTSTFSYIATGRSAKARRMYEEVDPADTVAISTITEAEIYYGLAKKPEATRWRMGVEALLATVTILPWDSSAAREYGTMRAAMMAKGKALSAMDLLIAAHAACVGAVLVTGDQAFQHAEGLYTSVNWADDVVVRPMA